MRKSYIAAGLAIVLITALFGGCTNSVSSTAKVSLSVEPSGSQTPSISIAPIPTTAPEATPDVKKAASSDDDSKSTIYEGWEYYLDINDPIVENYNEDPPLHKRMADSTGDTALGIRGYNFDIIGDYIYVDTNDPDLDENGSQTWSTSRINLDGSGKKELEYANMSERLVPDGEQKFYFTTVGDSAIYISDFPCENVTTVTVNLPDQSELDSKLDKKKILHLEISDVKSGVINFTASYLSENGTELYNGTYKINADGSSVQKVKGSYYYYSKQNDNE